MNIRILYNVVLVRLGIRRVLPGDYVLAFPVEECGEELVEVPEHRNIILDSRMDTDYHCHILPGLDDGAQSREEAVCLARQLVRWGFQRATWTVISPLESPFRPLF